MDELMLLKQALKASRPTAERGTADHPCWCNGPWEREAEHHEFCRARRYVWTYAQCIIAGVPDLDEEAAIGRDTRHQ